MLTTCSSFSPDYWRSGLRELKNLRRLYLYRCDGSQKPIDKNMVRELQEQIPDCEINNVHVNSYPVSGEITYMAYHPGKYAVAKLPKSSVDNEHNTIVVRNDDIEVIFRQIAGFVARRIISYPEVGDRVEQGEEVGMIKFGSRVDVFLPKDVSVAVRKGDKVVSKKTVLAYF